MKDNKNIILPLIATSFKLGTGAIGKGICVVMVVHARDNTVISTAKYNAALVDLFRDMAESPLAPEFYIHKQNKP